MSVKVITELDGRPQASDCPRPLIRTGSAPRSKRLLPAPGPPSTCLHLFHRQLEVMRSSVFFSPMASRNITRSFSNTTRGKVYKFDKLSVLIFFRFGKLSFFSSFFANYPSVLFCRILFYLLSKNIAPFEFSSFPSPCLCVRIFNWICIYIWACLKYWSWPS